MKINKINTYLHWDPISNEDMSNYLTWESVDTNWIERRTGIKSRHFSPKDESMMDMVDKLIEKDSEIFRENSAIILSSVSDLSNWLFLKNLTDRFNIPIFNINNWCASFPFSIEKSIELFEKASSIEKVIILSIEQMSRILDMSDNKTANIFWDAATVTEIIKSKWNEDWEILSVFTQKNIEIKWKWWEIINPKDLLYVDYESDYPKIIMEWPKLFPHALNAIKESVLKSCDKAWLNISDIDNLYLHQANKRIIDPISESFWKKSIINVDKYWNTWWATIPLLMKTESSELSNGEIWGIWSVWWAILKDWIQNWWIIMRWKKY